MHHNFNPHFGRNDGITLVNIKYQFIVSLPGVLERQLSGSKSVHEQVNNEQLRKCERRILVQTSGEHDDSENADVDGHVELDELLDIDDHVPALDDGEHQHFHARVLEHDGGGLDRGVGGVLAHFDAHVCLRHYVHFFLLVASHAA